MKNLIQTIYIVVFSVVFLTFKDASFFSGLNKTIASGILGAIGAGLGALAYQLVSKKRDQIKYFVIGGLGIVLISISFYLNIKAKEQTLEDKLSAYLDSAMAPKMKEIMSRPIDTNALKPPKLTPEQYAKLITCEVCGYVALCPDSTSCYNCFSMKFDPTIHSDKDKWLRNEQSFWFSPDEKTNKVQFFEPKIENGFKKNLTWKPDVTEKEVLEYNKDK
jgi:hypothetical protein